MKIFNKKFVSGCLALALLGIAGCKKQLDINQDPNFPTYDQLTPRIVFPTAVLGTIGETGGDLAILGGMFSQFFTQASLAQQYTDVDSYNIPTTDRFVTGPWTGLFPNALKNYQFVIDRSAEQQDWVFYLMGTVMKVYTMQVMVDLYDQVPYTEALQGTTFLHPHFDDGYTIYTNLLTKLDTAISKDFNAKTNSAPGKQDMIFNGDVSKWIAFANTLKLKLYLRLINAHPDVAEAGIKELYNNGAEFLQNDAAVTNFTDAPGLDNPLYEMNKRQLNTTNNIRASKTFVSWLQENSDSRIVYYFQTPSASSINQGDYSNNNPTYQAAPTFRDVDHTEATDPVEFISAAESFFLQAEADQRYLGGSNAKTLYEQGVLASFASTGKDGSTYIAPGGVYEWGNELEGGVKLDPIAQIIRQKWADAAHGCHGIEAWFDKNRTGYPASSAVYSDDPSYIPGQLVIVMNSVLPAGQVPKRLVFPNTETTINPNAPAAVPTTTPVWWGK